MKKNMTIEKFFARFKPIKQHYVKNIHVQYALDKECGVDAEIIKHLSDFIVGLTRSADWKLEDDVVVDPNIFMDMLMDFEKINTNYFLYKTFIQGNFGAKVIPDENFSGGAGPFSGKGVERKTKKLDPMKMVNEFVRR